MNFLLLATLLMTPTPPLPVTVVVIDASTRMPIAGVNVRNLEALPSATPLVTDIAGRFTLATPALHVHLSRMGYAAQLVNRPVKQGSVPDTVQLLPQAVALGEVAVRPGKAVILSSVPEKGTHIARRLLPGQSVAVLVTPTEGQLCQLDQVRLFMSDRPKEGRIRVRLVNVLPGTGAEGVKPGENDLLPEAYMIENAQLIGAPKGRLVVDLAKYGLELPAAGVFIVLDALATNPADKPVSITAPTGGKGTLKMVLATNPEDMTTAHVLEADDFPRLDGMRFVGNPTWSRASSKPEWKQLGAGSANVRVELSVFTH